MKATVLSSVDGCGGSRLYTLSDEAALTMSSLGEVDQEEIRDGFIRFYGKFMRLLVQMAMMPFSPLEMNLRLIPLAQENVIVDVGNHVLVCEIDLSGDAPHVTIRRIKSRGLLAHYTSQAL
ncbi:hypothetical protein GU927_002550 [Rhodobacteraceae bacterium HSP-20]|uniref:Uncharacterized protein n=1 Tax=Paragemmobacter amnigenus TaxID=2852097 RepID=A0ABS6IYZ3_9RHOB|nr:hypothetical protein [Rhodobacter amnigenus]MBU9696718.1 hypothetical protein [Rhodobacter amnigenus]MBV4387945.1 hypothetical protein [Rhodobacter amnigenus]